MSRADTSTTRGPEEMGGEKEMKLPSLHQNLIRGRRRELEDRQTKCLFRWKSTQAFAQYRSFFFPYTISFGLLIGGTTLGARDKASFLSLSKEHNWDL